MDAKSIRAALRDIGLTLNACHNTIATDRLDAEPDETSWRIDHSREIALVHDLEREIAPRENPRDSITRKTPEFPA